MSVATTESGAPYDALTVRELLAGWRGRPAVDVEALAALIVVVSEALCADPDIAELELNPIRVAPDGVLAVDALITRMTGVAEFIDPRELLPSAQF